MASCQAWHRNKGECLETARQNICFSELAQGLIGSASCLLEKLLLTRPGGETPGPEAMATACWPTPWGSVGPVDGISSEPIPRDKNYQGHPGKGSEDLKNANDDKSRVQNLYKIWYWLYKTICRKTCYSNLHCQEATKLYCTPPLASMISSNHMRLFCTWSVTGPNWNVLKVKCTADFKEKKNVNYLIID